MSKGSLIVAVLVVTVVGVAALALHATRKGHVMATAGALVASGVLGVGLWLIGDDPSMGWDGLTYIIAGAAVLLGPTPGLLLGLCLGIWFGSYPPEKGGAS